MSVVLAVGQVSNVYSLQRYTKVGLYFLIIALFAKIFQILNLFSNSLFLENRVGNLLRSPLSPHQQIL